MLLKAHHLNHCMRSSVYTVTLVWQLQYTWYVSELKLISLEGDPLRHILFLIIYVGFELCFIVHLKYVDSFTSFDYVFLLFLSSYCLPLIEFFREICWRWEESQLLPWRPANEKNRKLSRKYQDSGRNKDHVSARVEEAGQVNGDLSHTRVPTDICWEMRQVPLVETTL